MNLTQELLLNKYGQGIESKEILLSSFYEMSLEDKRNYLKDLSNLIIQSKPIKEDIDLAILDSGLKRTYTPCILLEKGINMNNLYKIVNLPENEIQKVVILLLSLFKIPYNRRFLNERNNLNKWWYWDLSKIQEEELKKMLKIQKDR
ncbi:DUF5958 family protein [Apibacter adventoris]|uniref:Uncharacterized protein n=1 Tax=Apibacter adventoris TaxID=1679466 RepID=A0A2S8AE65_9FLAO|nr:DUF5958 family protein [Apibacter adventoris]PQL93348.1 hypothetical protein C4S77_05070 [Apibacter adventoris]